MKMPFQIKQVKIRRSVDDPWVIKWEVYGRIPGQQKPMRKRFPSRVDATAYCKELNAQAMAGTYPLTMQAKRGAKEPTLLEWYDRFIDDRKKSHKDKTSSTHRTRRNLVEHWLKTSGGYDRPIGSYTTSDFTDLVDFLRTNPLPFRQKLASNHTINGTLNSLYAVFNYVQKKQGEENDQRARKGALPVQYLLRNPLKDFPKMKTGKSRKYTAWTPSEMREIEAQLHPFYRPYFRVLVSTGLRAEEFVNLRWIDVNLEDRTILISPSEDAGTKGDQTREIPYGEVVAEVLNQQRNLHDKYVFTRMNRKGQVSTQQIRREIQSAIKKLGRPIRGTVLHCTRATYITNLFRQGTTPDRIMYLAGHTKLEVTMRYVMIDEDGQRKAVERLDSYFKD